MVHLTLDSLDLLKNWLEFLIFILIWFPKLDRKISNISHATHIPTSEHLFPHSLRWLLNPMVILKATKESVEMGVKKRDCV